MSEILVVESLDPDKAFKLRLEIYLRINAKKVRELSKNPHKFDNYIKEREKIIRSIAGERSVSENGKIIFP
jgi:hypothetical protein